MRLLLIFAFFLALSTYGREYEVTGRIFDARSEQRLGGGTLTVVNPADGKVCGSCEDRYVGVKPDRNNWFLLKFWTDTNDSLKLQLRIEQPGYQTRELPMYVGRGTPDRIEFKEPIWMVSDTSSMSVEMVRELREIAVVATRIKMVVKGDTLVYDAGAFRLSEGSMLDALVSQLPGVTLDHQGRISVNGKFVNSLLIDGKDFFKGDPNIALRNLPAYVVKNIKVYDRGANGTRGSTATSMREDLVMDVNLKKQYQQGFLANLEGGYGTDYRYMGRMFALEYARNGRIGMFANVNNINNDSRGPGIWESDWNERRANDGERRIVKTGVDWQWSFLNIEDVDRVPIKTFSLDGSLLYTLEHKNLKELVSGTQFLPDGNRYSRSVSWSRNRDEQFQGRFTIISNLNRDVFVMVKPILFYQTGRFILESTGGEFGINPRERVRGEAIDSVRTSFDGKYARENQLIYRNLLDSWSTRRALGSSGETNISIWNPYFGRHQSVNIYFDWHYEDLREHERENRHLDYRENMSFDLHRILFTRSPGHNVKLLPSVRYIKWFFHGNGRTELTFRYRMSYAKDRGARRAYLLSDPDMPLEDVVADINNTYYSNLRTQENGISVEANMQQKLGEDWSVSLFAGQQAKYLHRNLRYERGVIDTVLTRNTLVYQPDLRVVFSRNGNVMRKYELRFNAEYMPVTMTRLFNTVDNLDPLNIYLGNPDLRGSTTYTGMLHYEQRQSLAERVLSGQLWYFSYVNRVGQLKSYDRDSGVSSYKPVNVNGSYRLYGALDFTLPFPRSSKRFWLTGGTKCDYLHNPDYISESALEYAVKETVRNLSVTQALRLDWRIAPGYAIGTNLSATWRDATSTRDDFVRISAIDVLSGLTANIRFPGKIIFATDLSVNNRMGYEDPALNTTDWIWNARLERSWLNGRLTVKIDAYDILNRNSNVNVKVNSLGRTEIWTNTMSRYVMLSLLWRLNIMPKK